MWEQEFATCQQRSLADRRYVYLWADGIHFNYHIASHYHADHIGCAPTVFSAFSLDMAAFDLKRERPGRPGLPSRARVARSVGRPSGLPHENDQRDGQRRDGTRHRRSAPRFRQRHQGEGRQGTGQQQSDEHANEH